MEDVNLQFITDIKLKCEREFILGLSKVSAQTFEKLEASITARVTYNETLLVGGTFEPAYIFLVVKYL
ncbi:hypothetical protein BD779DRAFT_860750 [Infundibulicybe gibba]|nr:hypothetical protein BD779DRAFT_860750 [Infundibulicybe gibba]